MLSSKSRVAAGLCYNKTDGAKKTIWNVSERYDFSDVLYVEGVGGTSFLLPDASSLYGIDPGARGRENPSGNSAGSREKRSGSVMSSASRLLIRQKDCAGAKTADYADPVRANPARRQDHTLHLSIPRNRAAAGWPGDHRRMARPRPPHSLIGIAAKSHYERSRAAASAPAHDRAGSPRGD